ncbi:STAM-binding protein-like A isoform X1 [Ostrinia furnacalis]|uniref:STAM-binding protein-like A isoform X1 n=1 Tax=Ostrinia furnacalis TaxID=93504 RepID=UPI00103FD541|nr:STAM-binding protein-like A isoform X1 [Ostrinia furnacalis]XP_028172850.1 STAM-binding protein-like A isoform X1 [Ostrinia furnacalis]
MQAEDKRTKHPTDLASLEPAARVKQLANYGTMVEVDPNVPPRRYYRSGLEMVRMANVYLAEGSLENAYILFMKFMTLFLEKIRKHPEYASVPAQVKSVNQAKLKEVMPKAEKLKQKLLEQYAKEHIAYKENEEKRRKMEEERKKQEREDAKLAERLQADEDRRDTNHPTPHLMHAENWAVSPSAPPVDGVLYPDDFAAEPPRAPSHQYTPVPPLIPPSRPQSSDSTFDAAPLSARLGLRPVRVPAALLPRFLQLAAPNTARNTETCGILAGVLERDELKITHVVVPKQSGTPDSCSTTNEEEIFHYQDQHNLITLGWIHTHPTQTAFLSSVDLHTQGAYQLMMPEAVAIVQAPKYNETGYFALTPEYGMDFIAKCRQTGFHPHPNDPPLFYDVKHIRLDHTAPVEMVDLRR